MKLGLKVYQHIKFNMDSNHNKILADQEETCQFKSCPLWLKCVDENKKFFQDFTEGYKLRITIWGMPYQYGKYISTFGGFNNTRKRLFQTHLKA